MKNRGVTLIALVVTIIVLIILAGVSIRLVLGNNGIFTKTIEAKEENRKQTAKEIMNLKITNIQIANYAEKEELPTLQYLADRLCEDNEIEYVNLEKQKVGAINDKISIGTNTSIFTKLEEYPYEFEINSALQLASIDDEQLIVPGEIPEGYIKPKGEKEITISENGTYIEDISQYASAKIKVEIVGNGWTYVEMDIPETGEDVVLNCGYQPEVIYGNIETKDKTEKFPYIMMRENGKTFGYDGTSGMVDWSFANYLTSTGYLYECSKSDPKFLGGKLYLWVKQ